MTEDIGVATNAERDKTKRRSRIRSTKQGFVKNSVRGFRYKPRGDWFFFAKVRKLCFLCSCKQTRETSISQRRCAYVLRHPPERLQCTTDSGSERKVFITFEIWIFFLQKHMDLLQEAFIHTPELCEARFIMDARTLFHVFWTVDNKAPASPHCNAWRGQDNFLYNSDWIRLKEESHIHRLPRRG